MHLRTRDSCHHSPEIEERASRTSWVDVDVTKNRRVLKLADDAGGEYLLSSHRASDCEHPLAHHNLRCSLRRYHRRNHRLGKCLEVNQEDTDVFPRIRGQQPGPHFVLLVEQHREITRKFYDVVIRDHKACWVNKES